jgi:hypothetical protein
LAESIAAGGHYSSLHVNNSLQVMMTNIDNGIQMLNTNDCNCDPNPWNLACVPPDPNCGGDPGGGPGGPGGPGGNPQPPTAQPSGGIQVFDTQLGNIPLENVRVLAKRGLRRKETYTNAFGHFVTPLFFPGRTKIVLKYRNQYISVRSLRQKMIKLSLNVIKQKVGRYNPPLNNINFVVNRNSNGALFSRFDIGFMRWVAAQSVNARNVQLSQASSDQIKAFTGYRFVMYLNKNGAYDSRKPYSDMLMQSYIFQTRKPIDYIIDAVKIAAYIASKDIPGVVVTSLGLILGAQRPDAVLNYNTDPENLSSNEINQQLYRTFTEAGLYKATENDIKWKSAFKRKSKGIDAFTGMLGLTVKAAAYEIWETKLSGSNLGSIVGLVTTFVQNVIYTLQMPERDYYDMVTAYSETYGHIICNRRYSINADAIKNQYRQDVSSTATMSSHLRYLENWVPNLNFDEKRYERVGLIYDLNDSNVDIIINGAISYQDLVQGVTYKAMFSSITGKDGAINPNPELWSQFRQNVIGFYPGQSTNIINLFNAYNY